MSSGSRSPYGTFLSSQGVTLQPRSQGDALHISELLLDTAPLPPARSPTNAPRQPRETLTSLVVKMSVFYWGLPSSLPVQKVLPGRKLDEGRFGGALSLGDGSSVLPVVQGRKRVCLTSVRFSR